MAAATHGIHFRRLALTRICVALGLLVFVADLRADNVAFTNYLAQAALAEKRGDLSAAVESYSQAQRAQAGDAPSLCVLARRYCDLMCLTNAAASQKDLLGRALACSLQAVRVDPQNAAAHACMAVCYAKGCSFADLKTQLSYSRLFKLEAEKTIALDPSQDIAYYLLGRWHCAVANMGRLSQAFVKVVYGGLPKASNEDAIKNFQKAIELAPDRIMHHAGLAMVYEATGQRALEIAELEKCRRMKPAGLEDEEVQRDAEKKLAARGR